MAPWTSLVVLSTTVVIALSFPSPDGQYNIPDVGTGQRSQFYVLHSDGTYKYGYDTGDGAFESVKTHAAGDVSGKFGYTDPDGNEITLEYDSGTGGFVARGDHLPQPSPELTQALASVVRSSVPFIDPLASEDSDSSYDFKFQSDNYTRNEISDENGFVTGSFSYVDEFGRTRSYTYRAGEGIGFVIEGDDIPQDANSIAASASSPSTNFKTSTNFASHSNTRSGSHTRANVGAHSNRRTGGHSSSNFGAHTASSNRASGYRGQTSSHQSSHLSSQRASHSSQFNTGNAAISSQSSQAPRDASYSFSYNAEDHSRSETSDPDLNIQGSYSFIADDGQERTLNYVAGTGTGFQAEGAHLPVAPDADFGNRITTSSTRSSSTRSHVSSNANRHTHQRPSSFRPAQTSFTRTSSAHRQQTYQAPSVSSNRFASTQSFSGATNNAFRASSGNQVEEANIRSSSSPDGSYSFSYDSSSHSRSESGDKQNNVKGSFAFVSDDDGQQRQIQYEANSATGFTATGSHIPVGPEVPGAPSGQPTGKIVPVPEVRFEDPLADSDSDASYDFKFDSETYSRSETADADGNVSGTYTVVDDDGTRTTYRFRAGEGIGYESEIVSISQGPAPSKTSQSSSFQNQGSSAVRSSSSSSFSSSHSAGRPSTSSSFSSSQSVGRPSTSSSFSSSQSVSRPSTSYSRPQTSFRGSSTSSKFGGSSSHRTSGSNVNSLSTSGSRFSSANTSPQRSSLSTQTSEVFPGFQLHQYDAATNPEKFGYVLKFD